MAASRSKPELLPEYSLALAELFLKAPFGLCICDLDGCCLQVNERMAAINGKPMAKHPGRRLEDLNQGVAAVLGPIVQGVLADGVAVVDRDVEVSDQVAPGSVDPVYWRVGCYPLSAGAEGLWGVGIVVRDVTLQARQEAAKDERLMFEAFLSSLSATFVNVPISEVDSKIEQGLHKVSDFLNVDRCSIWRFMPEDDTLQLTHSYAVPGIKAPPQSVDKAVPVWTSLWRRGEMFKVSDVDDLPEALWREKEYCRQMGGIKSFLFIPLSVGGNVVGLVSFASYRSKKAWPDFLVQRLRLLGDVFGNALERKRADQEIQRALAEIEELTGRLEAENVYLRDQIKLEQEHDEIVGKSQGIRKVLQQVEQVAATSTTVLVQGETGTGKELVARAIHRLSPRRDHTMVKLNCAALPATLIESELFGHEKGAFTGAAAAQVGRFEAANGSTIFLDEIGELPLELQAKLLRVLQEGQFERLGSTVPIEVDVRVVAATNRDLAKAVNEGRFREDLYYRLNVFPVSVPPLRERRDDIPLLVWAMVKEFALSFGKTIEQIPRRTMEGLMDYAWPGNVRELRNVVERGMILSQDETLVVNLPARSEQGGVVAKSLAEVERDYILAVLERSGWRVRGEGGAAEILQLKPTTLESRMKKLGVQRKTA